MILEKKKKKTNDRVLREALEYFFRKPAVAEKYEYVRMMLSKYEDSMTEVQCAIGCGTA